MLRHQPRSFRRGSSAASASLDFTSRAPLGGGRAIAPVPPPSATVRSAASHRSPFPASPRVNHSCSPLPTLSSLLPARSTTLFSLVSPSRARSAASPPFATSQTLAPRVHKIPARVDENTPSVTEPCARPRTRARARVNESNRAKNQARVSSWTHDLFPWTSRRASPADSDGRASPPSARSRAARPIARRCPSSSPYDVARAMMTTTFHFDWTVIFRASRVVVTSRRATSRPIARTDRPTSSRVAPCPRSCVWTPRFARGCSFPSRSPCTSSARFGTTSRARRRPAARVDGGDARDDSAARGAVSTIRGVSATRDVRGETTFYCDLLGVRARQADVVDGERTGGVLSDPTKMTGMMRKNAMMIAPQMVTAAWVNFSSPGSARRVRRHFGGRRFRGMLQRVGGDAESGRDVCVESVVVLFEFPVWAGCFSLPAPREAGARRSWRWATRALASRSGMNADRAYASAREGLEDHQTRTHDAHRRPSGDENPRALAPRAASRRPNRRQPPVAIIPAFVRRTRGRTQRYCFNTSTCIASHGNHVFASSRTRDG